MSEEKVMALNKYQVVNAIFIAIIHICGSPFIWPPSGEMPQLKVMWYLACTALLICMICVLVKRITIAGFNRDEIFLFLLGFYLITGFLWAEIPFIIGILLWMTGLRIAQDN